MALHRIKSRGLGHVAIDDSDSDIGPSSKVIDDGRVKVQFHDTPQALAAWCDHFKSSFSGDLPGCPQSSPPPQPRRTNSVAFLPGVEKPVTSPRLNIAIHIVGSRGDVQPFIPIAQLLMKPPYGHRVRICTHAAFKEFVEAQGVEFFNIGGDPEALMAYMVKNPGLLPNRDSIKGGEVGKRRKEMSEIISGTWRSCIEAGDGMGEPIKAATVANADDLFLADVIIANPPSMGHIHCAQKLSIPLHMVFTMPWSPTKAFPHPLAAMSYGNADAKVANYLSFMMMELLTWQGWVLLRENLSY
jgi:sterol 3beta-glucosyltransferase